MNVEEATRSLEIARRKHAAGDLDSALRFCRKSVALSPSTPATNLLHKLEREHKNKTTPAASASKPTPSAARADPAPPEDKPFTPAQATLVKRVRACKVTDYYGILELKQGCEDNQVKKAYRKLALGLHPDKCSAPGAEEAFKLVSKAFQVLSDPNKRAVFDQTGSDPDSRGGGGGGGGGGGMASPFARGGGMGGQFGGEELSPEDLFQFFFGGGGGGASFGGGQGQFRTQFYGPGMRTQQRARPAGGQPQTPQSGWLQVAPLLILFAFSLLTQLPSLFGSAPIADPDFSFDLSAQFSIPRTTSSGGTTYFVNAKQFSAHPIYQDVLDANPTLLPFSSTSEPGTGAHRNDLLRHILRPAPVLPDGQKSPVLKVPTSLAKFERGIDRAWVQRLQTYCQQEINRRQQLLERERGFFGIGANWEKVKEITDARLEHCERLTAMGYNVRID